MLRSRPLRFDLEKASLGDLASLVAPPYDVIDDAEKKSLQDRNAHNVVRLILPDGEGDQKYANAGVLLETWKKERVLVRDEEHAYYKYEQTFAPPGDPTAPKRTRTGFLGLVRLSPFSDREILPHERTLSGPKEDRLKLFRATKTNLSPGFMLYRDPARALDAELTGGRQVASFSTPDGITHTVTKISDKKAVSAITGFVKNTKLLIADGHHRYETALRYSQEVNVAGAHENGAHKYFMVFFANEDDPNLVVYPTHRYLHDVAGFEFEKFLSQASTLFEVRRVSSKPEEALVALAEAGKQAPSFATFGAGHAHGALLMLKKESNLAVHPIMSEMIPALRKTDVAILHGAILEGILGITKEAQAAKTNLWYPQNAAKSLEELRENKGQALFLMNATKVSEVRDVAEAGEVMPQKSTFFYPKVLTGLTIHTLETDRDVRPRE